MIKTSKSLSITWLISQSHTTIYLSLNLYYLLACEDVSPQGSWPTTALSLGPRPLNTQFFKSLLSRYYEFTGIVLVVAVAAPDAASTILGMLSADGCIPVATWFSLFISSCQPGTFLAVMCLLACFVKWSDLIKRRPQRGQANRFSPVCVRLCLASSSDLAKRLSQFSHVHGKGFSPEKHKKEKKINFLTLINILSLK